MMNDQTAGVIGNLGNLVNRDDFEKQRASAAKAGLRHAALQMANRPEKTADEIVADARKFVDFISEA